MGMKEAGAVLQELAISMIVLLLLASGVANFGQTLSVASTSQEAAHFGALVANQLMQVQFGANYLPRDFEKTVEKEIQYWLISQGEDIDDYDLSAYLDHDDIETSGDPRLIMRISVTKKSVASFFKGIGPDKNHCGVIVIFVQPATSDALGIVTFGIDDSAPTGVGHAEEVPYPSAGAVC